MTSLGCDVSVVFRHVCDGISGIGTLQETAVSEFGRLGGRIPDFDLSAHMQVEGRIVRRLDRFVQFGMVAAQAAINQAAIDVTSDRGRRCGVIIGSALGGLNAIEAQHNRLHFRGPERVSALMIPSLMINAAAANVAVHWGLTGPSSGISAVCASGTQAIGQAFRMIQSGVVDMMVCGGTEAPLTPAGIAGFEAAGCLSSGNHAADAGSRPFDRDRDGCVLAEGAGLLVLEDAESALRRGAAVLAEVAGYGQSWGPSAIGNSRQEDDGPTVNAMAQAMETALADAQCTPAAIDYVNASAAGTVTGDRAEALAIRAIFGSENARVAVSSTKGQVGHLVGASGGVESAFCIHALQTNTVPPTANLNVTGPGCDLNHVVGASQSFPVGAVINNSFSFGGHNASIVFRDFCGGKGGPGA